MVEITFKHWKTQKALKTLGTIVFNNPESDRLVIKNTEGNLEDIIKSTILEIRECESDK